MPRSMRPSPEEWVTHKEAIQRLYLEENLPLAEVVAIMARDHNFSAG